MLAFTSIFPLLAVFATSAKASANSATANAPTSSNPSTTFEFTQGNSTTWTKVDVSNIDISSQSVSWRIAGNNDSSVNLSFNSSNNVKGYGGADTAVHVVFSVNTTYTNASETSPSGPVVIPVTSTMLIRNLYCADDQNFTALVHLTNGTVIRKTYINHLHVSIPPETVSVDVTQIDLGGVVTDTTTINYPAQPLLTAQFGSQRPTIAATNLVKVDYCTEDD